MKTDVWIFRSADSRNLALIPHNLDYFQTRFVCKPMKHDWEPPPVTIDGKSHRLRDFVSWMAKAPVVSERAKDAMENLLGPNVEFLPLIELRGKQYFAINVLKLVDCLDIANSEIVYGATDPRRIMNIKRYALLPDRIEDVPIFKVPDYRSAVFVTKPFVDLVIKAKLTGAKFADPTANPWQAILHGKSCNTVPGVLE